MASRILIFDHNCKSLGELSVPTTPRNWVLNDYGRAQFSLGYDPTTTQSSQEVREELLQFGNLVHIIHVPSKDESGNYNGMLPDWTGIILPPQRWDFGVCHVNAYSAEAILMFRALKHRDVKSSPKNVLRQIFEIVHERARNIIFQPGILDDKQTTYPDALRTNAYDHIKKLVRDTGMDWDISGRVVNGSLNFYVNLYYRRGQNVNVTLTSSNTELGSPLFELQGNPFNQIFGYSQAQTARGRFGPIEVSDQGSVDDYGPLQLNQVMVGKKDPSSVESGIQSLLNSRSRPVKLINRIALDESELFTMLEVGNVVRIMDTNVGFSPNGGYGFESTARIVGMDYNDLSNKVPLKLEVV